MMKPGVGEAHTNTTCSPHLPAGHTSKQPRRDKYAVVSLLSPSRGKWAHLLWLQHIPTATTASTIHRQNSYCCARFVQCFSSMHRLTHQLLVLLRRVPVAGRGEDAVHTGQPLLQRGADGACCAAEIHQDDRAAWCTQPRQLRNKFPASTTATATARQLQCEGQRILMLHRMHDQ